MKLVKELVFIERGGDGHDVRVVFPVGTECRFVRTDSVHHEALAVFDIVQRQLAKGERYASVVLGDRPRAVPESDLSEV